MFRRNCLWTFPANGIIQNLIFLCVKPMCFCFGTRGSSWSIFPGLGDQQIYFIICILMAGFQVFTIGTFLIILSHGTKHRSRNMRQVVTLSAFRKQGEKNCWDPLSSQPVSYHFRMGKRQE